MINLQKIYKIGYGFGFGGTFATNAKYKKNIKKLSIFFALIAREIL